MALQRCEKGHYYDGEKFSSCPHCGISLKGLKVSNVVRSTDNDKTVAKYNNENKTVAMGLHNSDDDIKTVGVFRQKYSGDPVVGWLVCLSGAEQGRDYRLHAARNFIGRSAKADINIFDDPQISRENHASVVFDPKSNQFSLVPGENTLTSINGKFVENAESIYDGDELTFGGSKFIFIAFCKGDRKWEE